MIDLTGKVSLVTGGSRGIGRAVVLRLAQAGSDVAINYRRDEASAAEVEQAARELGVNARAVQADIADRQQVTAMINTVLDEFGRVDILVNNAGIWVRNPIDSLPPDRLQQTIDANLMGTFYTIMAVVSHMIERGSGTIINISSTAGQRGEAYHSPYAASKGAVQALTKSLAAELAASNIRVNCVAPGWVRTDMSRKALDAEDAQDIRRQIPLGRAATADEIAAPVLFLVSDMASFITGEVLNVNGGAVLCG